MWNQNKYHFYNFSLIIIHTFYQWKKEKKILADQIRLGIEGTTVWIYFPKQYECNSDHGSY